MNALKYQSMLNLSLDAFVPTVIYSLSIYWAPRAPGIAFGTRGYSSGQEQVLAFGEAYILMLEEDGAQIWHKVWWH